MPFKRTMRKRKFKRSFRRKRRVSRKKSGGYSSQVGIKLNLTIPIAYSSLSGFEGCDTVFGWGNEMSGPNTYSFAGTALWATLKTVYKQYKITYMKIRYNPVHDQRTSLSWKGLHVASDPDTQLQTTTTIANLQSKPDYRNYQVNTQRGYVKNVNVAKAMKKQGIQKYGWNKVGTTDANTNGSTLFRMSMFGAASGDIMATATVTWYCQFRDLTL